MGARLTLGEVTLELKGSKLRVGNVVEIMDKELSRFVSIENIDPRQKSITVAYSRGVSEVMLIDEFEKRYKRTIPISWLVNIVNSARSI